MRPADYYKLSPLSYAIVANTFRMNIPIPQDLTPSERYRGMRIPLAGPQLSRTQRAVTSHAEAETPYEEAQSSAVQAPQDRKIMDHVSATANVTTEDCRMTDKTPTTQDPPTPAKAEKPDELVGGHKVPFHMMRSRFVSLLLRVIGYKGASTEPRTKVQSIPGCQDQVSTAPSGGQVN